MRQPCDVSMCMWFVERYWWRVQVLWDVTSCRLVCNWGNARGFCCVRLMSAIFQRYHQIWQAYVSLDSKLLWLCPILYCQRWIGKYSKIRKDFNIHLYTRVWCSTYQILMHIVLSIITLRCGITCTFHTLTVVSLLVVYFSTRCIILMSRHHKRFYS